MVQSFENLDHWLFSPANNAYLSTPHIQGFEPGGRVWNKKKLKSGKAVENHLTLLIAQLWKKPGDGSVRKTRLHLHS